jgi:hypothetical protein
LLASLDGEDDPGKSGSALVVSGIVVYCTATTQVIAMNCYRFLIYNSKMILLYYEEP